MATKQFTKHAQRVLNHNPSVVKCTTSKIIFTDEFASKVCAALKAGEDPYAVFTANGLSIRILGKSSISGAIGLWRSKYGLEGLPRRKPAAKPKKPVVTAQERRAEVLKKAIADCDQLIANPTPLNLQPGGNADTLHFAAIRLVYEKGKAVVVKDLCSHYGYPYPKYYLYLKSLDSNPDTFVNILNPHRKK